MAMKVMEVGGETARNRWGEMVDTAIGGGEVIVKRHRRPVAVLVGYEQWDVFKRAFLAMLQERSKEAAAGNFVLFEDVEKDLKAQGII